MKQSKRLLSMLLAMVICLTTLTVGASAYKTSYQNPAGYDKVMEPYFSLEQAASALLDYLDEEVFAPINMNESYLGVDLVIRSIDTTFDTLDGIESAKNVLGGILGDIGDLNLDIPGNSSIRRRSTSLSDFTVLTYVLQFLSDNSDPVYKLVGNDFDLGVIGWFMDLGESVPAIANPHAYVCEMLYGLLIDPNLVGFDANTANLDNMIQDFLNNRVISFVGNMLAEPDGSNSLAEFLGLAKNTDGTLVDTVGLLQVLPSLSAADIDIKSSSAYNFVEKLFAALIDDIAIPLCGPMIVEALEIDPNDPAADTSYIDIAIDLFVKYEYVGLTEDAGLAAKVKAFLEKKGVENPEAPKPIDKTNATLEFILKEGISQYIYFQDDGAGGKYLTLAPDLNSQITTLIKTVIPLLNTFIPEVPPLTAEQSAALNDMGDEETFAFCVQLLLDGLVEGVRFPGNCKTIKELVTYTLVNVAAELVPSIDFEAKIESGEIVPNSIQCMDVAAAVLRYYAVGQTGITVPNETPTFEELLDDCFDYFLGKYSTLFNVFPDAASQSQYGNNVWYKVYMSVCQWIPLTNILYGCEDSYIGVKEIFMDKILNSVLNFDFNGLLSIIGKRPDSCLNKPLSQVFANLLARILNGIFGLENYETSNKSDNASQRALIIPYAYTTLNEILVKSNGGTATNGCGLQNTARMLLAYLPRVTRVGGLLRDSIDLVATLLGVIDLDNYEYMQVHYRNNCAPGTTYNINQLKTLHSSLKIPDNEGLNYYDEEYSYFRMVDNTPWAYVLFKEKLSDAKDIIDQYDESILYPGIVAAPARTEITYAYYALEHTYTDLLQANPITANDYQLDKVYNRVIAAQYTNVNEDGSQKYTNRSWADYQQALAFAEKVIAEYNQHEASGTLADYRQSKVNMARQMLIDTTEHLKANIGDADYSELVRAIARIENVASPYNFSEDAVNDVIKAYKAAVKFNGEVKYDIDSQSLVDSVTDALNSAYDSLEPLPNIELFDPTLQHIDLVNSYIFGFEENFYNENDQVDYFDFNDYFTWNFGYPSGGDYIDIRPTLNGSGTGSKICIVSDPDGDGIYDDINRQYTMIMFGDVNGDAKVDAMDSVLMKAYSAFMLDITDVNSYITYAGDLNYDGSIGTSDAKRVANAGLKLAGSEISQLPENYTQQEVTFLDLVNR